MKTPRINFKNNQERELGFGKGNLTNRIMNADGSTNIIRKGISKWNPINIYHFLVKISWLKFLIIVVLAYTIINCIFALGYLLIGIDQLSGISRGNLIHEFGEAFFFSSQSLTTVGYGRVAPTTYASNTLAAIESLLGLMTFALATGLLYGRFSRPTAVIMYSDNCLIAPFKESNAFMFRVANARKNQLIEVEANVILAINTSVNGKQQRVFQNLELELKKINFLAMTWTIVHPIDENSPMHGLNKEDIDNGNAEILILIKAIDDTYATSVYSRSSYDFNQFKWGAKFNSVVRTNEKGKTEVDLHRLNEFTEL